MVSTKTLNMIKKLNNNYNNNNYNDNNNNNDDKIYVYIQSNVEDVAVYMRHLFLTNGHFTVPSYNQLPAIFHNNDNNDIIYNNNNNDEDDDSLVVSTKRGLQYQETVFPKAGGDGWMRNSPFRKSFSETEMQYEYDNKRIYRFILATK